MEEKELTEKLSQLDRVEYWLSILKIENGYEQFLLERNALETIFCMAIVVATVLEQSFLAMKFTKYLIFIVALCLIISQVYYFVMKHKIKKKYEGKIRRSMRGRFKW